MIRPQRVPVHDRSSLLEHALDYADRGWSIIPVNGKKPVGLWKPFQSRPADPQTLQRLFARDGITGLAVITGAVSGGLAVRDFDTEGSYEAWAASHADEAQILPTVKTWRGFHVYGRLAEETYVKFGNGELRGDSGHYHLLPPSLHPEGVTYSWIIPLPDGSVPELPYSLRCDATQEGTQECHTRRTQDDLCGISPKRAWNIKKIICDTQPAEEGQRNDCIFDLARRLKGAIPDADITTLRNIVHEWHKRALAVIATKEFLETWTDFLRGWDSMRKPHGSVFQAAMIAADQKPPPIPPHLYYDGHLLRLASFCYQLQKRWVGPFPLGCRDAALFLGFDDHKKAWRLLKVLQADGVLTLVKVGTQGVQKDGRVSEWRFNESTD